jgi:hypothetical protein
MFFKADSMQSDVEEALERAILAPPETNAELAKAKAKAAAADAVKGGGGLLPQWATFIAAAIVFLILLAAAIYTASLADAQPATVTSSQLKDASATIQTLLVAWSAAVVGLIAGEAVGKKSA